MTKTTIICDACGREIPNDEPRWNLLAKVQNAYFDVTTVGRDKFTRWDGATMTDVCKECMESVARTLHISLKVI